MKRLDDNAALILIDLQKGIQFPKLGRRNNLDAEHHLAALLAHWRDTARPVVHVRQVHRGHA